MIFEDDDLPKNAPKKPKPLDNMSVDELQEYIQTMKDEITRVEGEIKKKQAHAQAADALFGKKS